MQNDFNWNLFIEVKYKESYLFGFIIFFPKTRLHIYVTNEI